MAGPHSDAKRAQQEPAHDGYQSRRTVRISNLYAASWRLPPDTVATPIADRLRLGRLTGFYQLAAGQLPAVVATVPIDPATIWTRRFNPAKIGQARAWLLALPSGQVMAGLTLDASGRLTDTIDLLEDCYYEDITIDNVALAPAIAALAPAIHVPNGQAEFAPERHQVVFSRALRSTNPQDLLQRIIYRADLPHRPEHSIITYPAELNRRPTTVAAVGPYVSVLCGQQDYLENAAFASAAQAVASAARLREIRETLHQDLLDFRNVDTSHASTRSRRVTLEQIFNELTALELDLSLSVEAPRDLRLLIPSLRVVSYHEHIYDAIGLVDLAATISRMLRRLEATVRAELTSVESIERRADQDRRLRWGVAIGFVSTVAIPISLILAFFGINATQVTRTRSMFDPAYLWVYSSVGILALIAVTLAVSLYLVQRRRHLHHTGGGPHRYLGASTGPAIPPQRAANTSEVQHTRPTTDRHPRQQ